VKFNIGSRTGRTLLGSAAAIGIGLLVAGSAQAATLECDGSVHSKPGSKSSRAFEYDLSCTSPQGNQDFPTVVDAYSIVSTKAVLGFGSEVIVTDPEGEAVPSGESFGCEGPFPGDGFGCNGKMSLGNTATGELTLAQNPCGRKGIKTPFRVWAVAAADKISDTEVHTKTISEPFKLAVPKCPKPGKGKGKGGKHR